MIDEEAEEEEIGGEEEEGKAFKIIVNILLIEKFFVRLIKVFVE